MRRRSILIASSIAAGGAVMLWWVTSSRGLSRPSCDGHSRPRSIDAADASVGEVVDVDQDGIDDVVEDWLAERFAPIVYHDRDESNYPVAVEWLLKRTGLHEFDTGSSTGIAT